MARRAPNYNFERAERTRAKERKRAERLEKKRADAEKRKTERNDAPGADSVAPNSPSED